MRRGIAGLILISAVGWMSCLHTAWAEEPGPAATARAEALIDRLAKGDFEGVVKEFDATLSGMLPAAKLGEVWKQIQAQAGPFQGRLGGRYQKVQGYDVVKVTCQFGLAPLDAIVSYNSEGKVAGLRFVPAEEAGAKTEYKAPPYVKPGSFVESELKIEAAGGCPLGATLTLPKGDGPFPAVVLVHGSGPHDRDETLGPNKPFKDLAWGLASRGVAVLRYEKRTKACPEKLTAAVTLKEETVDDAVAAAALMRRTPKVDAGRVFVLGHSLGGVAVPRIGAADGAIAGFVVMAGTVRPLEEILIDQLTYLSTLPGGEALKPQLEQVKVQVAKVKDPKLSPSTPATELPLGVPAPYWLDLRGYDPAEAAKALHRPLLVLQGERDYQATMVDFARWKKALAGSPAASFKSYPTLNHLFQEGEGKATPAEYDREGHVAEPVVADIAAFLLKR